MSSYCSWKAWIVNVIAATLEAAFILAAISAVISVAAAQVRISAVIYVISTVQVESWLSGVKE